MYTQAVQSAFLKFFIDFDGNAIPIIVTDYWEQDVLFAFYPSLILIIQTASNPRTFHYEDVPVFVAFFHTKIKKGCDCIFALIDRAHFFHFFDTCGIRTLIGNAHNGHLRTIMVPYGTICSYQSPYVMFGGKDDEPEVQVVFSHVSILYVNTVSKAIRTTSAGPGEGPAKARFNENVPPVALCDAIVVKVALSNPPAEGT